MGNVIVIIVLCLLIGYVLLISYGLFLKNEGQYPFVEADLVKKGGKYARNSDGRIIEYFTYGKLTDYDYVVINMHGSGLEAKYECEFYSSVCEGLNVKGILISMPGCGYSDIQPGRVVYNWANDDLRTVLEAEDVKEFMITGHSQGTIHAMAAAKYFGNRCIGLGLYAPFIPKNQLKDKKIKSVIGDGYVPYTKTLEKIYGA
ncbi:alpha/beta fold hydrolase [Clostridium sp.]|uniref:alpha/beta fold hydrolase n=1 Tax=Clostridium sp. TaxID=1506 RepID=UPI003F4C9857